MANVEELMKILDCTEEEALDVIEQDKIIDKGGRTYFDFDKEKEKMAKKFANVETHKKPTVYKWDKRQRKENVTKREIISELYTFLTEKSENNIENCKVTNAERQIFFKIGDKSFELTLVEKRKPKN